MAVDESPGFSEFPLLEVVVLVHSLERELGVLVFRDRG